MTEQFSPTASRSRYRILETLGRGGMGEVCLADDLMLDRRVGLKFLTSAPECDALDQLLSEARAAAALDHPFICKIHEVTELDHRPCIVMEYVRGETIERRLRRGPLPLVEGLRIAEEIAEALEAAHKRRVVHRDLKPRKSGCNHMMNSRDVPAWEGGNAEQPFLLGQASNAFRVNRAPGWAYTSRRPCCTT